MSEGAADSSARFWMPASVNFRPTRIPTVVTDALLNCRMFSATTTHEIPAASAAHQ
jgi:hypothetical protein